MYSEMVMLTLVEYMNDNVPLLLFSFNILLLKHNCLIYVYLLGATLPTVAIFLRNF